tara:strand:+ start:32 stop:250 length:219 start_codon:yes stop_codon:yes gene_type:complete
MKLIVLILKSVKSLFPYFLLIALYFFFINLESREEQKNKSIIKNKNKFDEDKSSLEYGKQLRVPIPVVPYRQ